MKAYLQHGRGTQGPFRTESVQCIDSPMTFHKLGLSYTQSGYGSKIPTPYKVLFEGRWHRVYCKIYSNIGVNYIVSRHGDDGTISVDLEH